MALSNSEFQRLLASLRAAGVKLPIVEGLDTLRRLLTAAVRGRSLSSDARQILAALQILERESRTGVKAAIPGSPGGFRSGQTPIEPPSRTANRLGPPPRNQLRTRVPQGYPEEQPSFSDEFFTPTSSNVYSFQFFRRPGENSGTLFVTFKASSLNHGALSHGAARNKEGHKNFHTGRKQLHGIAGHTVGRSRPNAPGPTYQYTGMAGSGGQGVPYSVFIDMKRAYSKGTFVWEVLRGHKKGTPIDYNSGYRYGLVVGQLVGKSGMQYVPRKATNRGYVTRSVSDTGTGRRSFISSTLPPSTSGGGFSTRRR